MNNNSPTLETAFEILLRRVVREEIRAALDGDKRQTARKDWLRAEELAEEYGLPRTWFEERGRTGELARTKPGRYVLFCPASPRHALLAESLGKPSLWVIISAPRY